MSKIAFIDPATGQVMAPYEGCRPEGTHWQDQGFVEVQVPGGIGLTRDKRLTVEERGGKLIATRAEDFENPVKPPPPPPPEKTALELKLEELEARLKAVEEKPLTELEVENMRLKAELAPFDGDGDGSIGGSKPRA